MISPEEALALVLESVRPLGSEAVDPAEAAGRVLAEDITASCDLPPFDNSAMDGYAVRAADLAAAGRPGPVSLRVLREARAGAACAPLPAGSAARVFTGAPLPEGADAVVMQERVERSGEAARFGEAAEPGDHIRPRGEDVRAGELLLARGALLRPYEVSLLAAQGVETVSVVRRARVSILATGDELVPAGRLADGPRLRDANGPGLAAAVARWGALPRRTGIAPDEPGAQRRALESAFEGADLVLVTGGVSVGDYDFTRAVLESLGTRIVFWKVAIKPGKPLLFGLREGTPVFGLPGNPVAALVCAEEFARPALEALHGRRPSHPPYHLEGTAANDYALPAGRRQYLFCTARRDGADFRLDIVRPQGSAMLGMARKANALALSPEGAERVRAGDRLRFRWLK